MNTSATPSPAQPQVQLAIQKIYLKDASFETPAGVKVFQQAWSPKLSQQLQTRSNKLNEQHHEVVLVLTLTAIMGEAGKEETAFLVEVQQAGLFQIIAPDVALEKHIVNTTCPTILLPYAREAVDNLVVKGGFPPISIPPVNFDVLYQQALAQQQNKPAH
jgi:preprotein translocase subunit SecB